MQAPTWHNAARPGDFAETVLMPGDPKRSEYIAKHYLEGARLVNDIRGVQGYTGTYKGKSVSVMASGMGMPAIAIYAQELYQAYSVRNIIRLGTAGALRGDIGVMDIVASMACCTDSNFGAHYRFPGTISPTASFELLLKAHQTAARLGIRLVVGPTMCSDVLYDEFEDVNDSLRRMHLVASEMEAAALYMTAMREGKNALCLCTIVEDPATGREVAPDARERALDDMIRLALEMA